MDFINRKDAIERGLTKYYDGKPCKNGHLAEKHTANYSCIVCHAERQKKLYEKNPEKYKNRRKTRYWENPEKARQSTRDWIANNITKVKQSNALYYKNNSEKIKNQVKEYRNINKILLRTKSKIKYNKLTVEQKNKIVEKRRQKLLNDRSFRFHTYEKAKEYRNNNKNLIRSHRSNYRARKKIALGVITPELIELRHKQQKNLCYYCDTLYNDQYHIDHMVPLVRGGTNEPHNICIACIQCNLRKHTKMPWDFLKLIAHHSYSSFHSFFYQ